MKLDWPGLGLVIDVKTTPVKGTDQDTVRGGPLTLNISNIFLPSSSDSPFVLGTKTGSEEKHLSSLQ